MKKSKLLGMISAAVICLSSVPTVLPANAANDGIMRDITTMELIQDMGIGINLGNTMESCGSWIDQWGDGTPNAYETAWGSPTITQSMIQGYADEGFKTLRIPVAWSNMMSNDRTYTISKDYAARVKQIVDWALDEDMYVILNLHYDGGWLENLPTDYNACLAKYSAIWTQVSEEFKDYSDYLIFESQNEELGWSSVWNPWGGNESQKETSYGYVNEINQTFVDIVRASGGNNSQRHLLISGYNTDIARTCDSYFKMPQDIADRCAVSVHYYTPAGFAILEEDADWGKASSTWGSNYEYAELNQNFDMLKDTFTSKGIPVIVGEYGCPTKNKESESVRRFITSVCEAALSRGGICPVLWDVTGLHYDRDNHRMFDSELKDGLVAVRDKYLPEKEQNPEPEQTVKGDVNGDGELGVLDIVKVQKYLHQLDTLPDWKAADLNEDNQINIYDLILLKRMLLN